MREDYGFEDGLFTGYDAENASTISPPGLTNWTKTASPTRYYPATSTLRVELAETARFRYTPDVVENICGTPKDAFLKSANTSPKPVLTIKQRRSSTPRLDATLHRCAEHPYDGDDPLLLGNMGMAGGGVNALRGHSIFRG